MSKITILVGAQWGDEGKGKWVDILSNRLDIVARFQGGNNAGHTLYVDGEKIVLHQLPSGVFQKNKIAALLSGVVINPVQLAAELKSVQHRVHLTPDNLWISEKAHIITPYHILQDTRQEQAAKNPIGTTKRGIGPSYSDKIERTGMQVRTYVDPQERQLWLSGMLEDSADFRACFESKPEEWQEFFAAAAALQPYVNAAEREVRTKLNRGFSLLLEGAQGTLLDISHGTYPFVTSSSTIAGGAIASLGIDPRKVTDIYGIAKAYVTRVGQGPFPTEMLDATGEQLREKGQEYGATTKRPRRCGWFDAVAMRYAVQVNGFDQIFLNKMDILSGFSELKIAYSYRHPRLGPLRDFPADRHILAECVPEYENIEGWSEEIANIKRVSDLPAAVLTYIKRIETLSEIKVGMIGTGPGRHDFIGCD